MVLTEKQWSVLTYYLEIREYRYSDNNDTESKEAMLFYRIQNQLLNNKIINKKPQSIRLTDEKKEYLTDLINERIGTIEETGYNTEDIKILEDILFLLKC